MQYNPALDCLRAFAILAVVCRRLARLAPALFVMLAVYLFGRPARVAGSQ